MGEFDYLTIILPTIIASVTTFVVLGVKKLGSASEGTLSGTIKLENVQANVGGLEHKMDKGFDRIEELINNADKENRSTFNKLWERIEQLNTDMRLHEYRLDRSERNGNGKHGGDKSPL